MSIKELRISKKLTQKEAANLIGLTLRTYQNYEMGVSTRDKFKINAILKALSEYEPITEEKGLLSIDDIKEAVSKVCKNYDVNYVYLFGSYAKGYSDGKSDVDLMIECNVHGLEFLGLAEDLRNALHKNVDLIQLKDIRDNATFLNEILSVGVRVYG